MTTDTTAMLHRPSRVDEETRTAWRIRGFLTHERIGTVLEDRAIAMPDREAVITSSRSVTFAQLQAASSAVARTLLAAGIGRGDVVCWMLPTDAEAIAVASAIWRIGAVSSPIVPIYGRREMSEVVSQLHPAAVIADADVRGRQIAAEFDEVFAEVGHVPRARLLNQGAAAGWRSASAEGPGALPAGVEPASADDPSLVLFTSGTESAPKGAIHSTAGLMHELRSCISEWGVTFRDRMFMASPMTHITGLLQGFLIPARVGGAAVLMDRWDPDEAVALIERTGASYMAGATPFLRELLASYASAGLPESSLRQYCCGGAAVPASLIREAGDLGIAAYKAWGMTELPTSSLSNELDPLELRATSDGRLAPGVEMRVLDEAGDPVEPGTTGRLQLRGPEMMLGYVRHELDDKAFAPGGWLETGDVGSLGIDGRVRISGRTKDIINRGGEKLSAREIEEVLSRHPDVVSVAVTAVPGGRLGERVGAVVVSRTPDLTLADLAAFVTDAGAARQKRPEALALVDEIPSTATGKVDRRALLALLPADAD